MSVISEGDELINGDREKDYGHPKESFRHIARLWDAYIKNILEIQSNILPKDVINMLSLMKKARHARTSTPVRDQRDSVRDDAGYVGLLERLEE